VTWSASGRHPARRSRCLAWRRSRCRKAGTPRPSSRTVCRAARPVAFATLDKGNLATIGRSRAVADIKGIHLSGFIAWITWLTVHLFYLIGFENRLLVLIRWSFSFATHGRGARLIAGDDGQ